MDQICSGNGEKVAEKISGANRNIVPNLGRIWSIFTLGQDQKDQK